MFGPRSDDGKARLPGGRARKSKVGPDDPHSNALIFRKRGVGAFDGRAGSGSLSIVQQKNGARFGIAAAFERNDRAIPDAGLFTKGSFEVLGINVETGGRDDDLVLPGPGPHTGVGGGVAE